METVQAVVKAFRKQHNLGKHVFAMRAGSSNTTVYKAERGDYDKDLSSLSGHGKQGAAGAIHSLIRACGEDPERFLQAAGLEGICVDYTEAGRLARADPGILDRLLNTPMTKADLTFLLSVQEGLEQPLTFGLALELVKRRSKP